MSRSGYSEDYDEAFANALWLYRKSVENAIKGKRGQALLCRLRDALDALPVKRLIAGEIKDAAGEVCAFGALDPNAPAIADRDDDDGESATALAKHFGIARSLAAEIVYMNDEWWSSHKETPEQRWTRMRRWVDEQIAKPTSA